MLEWRTFEEGSVKAVGYDAETHELQVEFASTGLYSYAGIPKSIADGMINAKSRGMYLAQWIRDKYAYTCLRRAPVKGKPDASKQGEKQEEVESKSVQRPKAAQRKRQPI